MADEKRTGLWTLMERFDWLLAIAGFGFLRPHMKGGGSGEADPLKSSDDEHAILAAIAALDDGTRLGKAKFGIATEFYRYLERANKLGLSVKLRQLLSRVKSDKGEGKSFSPGSAAEMLSTLLGVAGHQGVTDERLAAEIEKLLADPTKLDAQFAKLVELLEIALINPFTAAVKQRWEELKEWNRKEDERGAAAVQSLLDDET